VGREVTYTLSCVRLNRSCSIWRRCVGTTEFLASYRFRHYRSHQLQLFVKVPIKINDELELSLAQADLYTITTHWTLGTEMIYTSHPTLPTLSWQLLECDFNCGRWNDIARHAIGFRKLRTPVASAKFRSQYVIYISIARLTILNQRALTLLSYISSFHP
jgi:hypothetical protein